MDAPNPDLIAKLADRAWRLENLYQILAEGQVKPFIARPEQLSFRENRHNRNFVPKARKLGLSTEIVLENGDECVFTPNFKAAIIDRSAADAEEKLAIFRLAWEKGPEHPDPDIAALWKLIHAANPLVRNNDGELEWSNGSNFQAGTSFTGRTPQRLHISELGPICDASEAKGNEIMQGSINSVLPQDILDVETTMRAGQTGACARLFKLAKEGAGKPLTVASWRLQFFSWLGHPDYSLPGQVPTDGDVIQYFQELERDHGIKATPAQQAWYQLKQREQGDSMLAEYPSWIGECDKAMVQGAIYPEMAKLRMQGRVRDFEPEAGLPIFSFWDLGCGPNTAGWLIQPTARDINILDWTAGEGLGADYLATIQREWALRFGPISGMFIPHDADIRDKGSGLSFRTQIISAGIPAHAVHVVPRIPDVWVGISEVRKRINRFWMHSRCDVPVKVGEIEQPSGVARLEGYRIAKASSTGVLKNQPHGDICSHTADAMRTYAEADKLGMITAASSAGAMAVSSSIHGQQGQQIRAIMGMRG
ncbi:hypothetical protein WJU23_05290 [Prosthecobacter sp. SYSU 5D2]|uniref:hypothetical protein n=1 Tax=Prosthecobacter sp. SYSU 5D2 TaxID=3134134 RepID=UPI0031FEC2DD